MSRDFSTNSNLSLRVVGGKMRRSLVSPGAAFRKRMWREASRRNSEKQFREDKEIIERMRAVRRGEVNA